MRSVADSFFPVEAAVPAAFKDSAGNTPAATVTEHEHDPISYHRRGSYGDHRHKSRAVCCVLARRSRIRASHRAHHTGALASEVTGVPGAEISLAVLRGYGHKIGLLEYHAPADRKQL